MKALTIFTPTYNRAYIISRLYISLCEQTCKDFVWLVVDDGSIDNTEELIRQWQNDNHIEIRYFYQNNGGKMRAHNQGVLMADTELFLCVDSDDRLASSSVVNDILVFWSNQKNSNFNGILSNRDVCGVISYKQTNGKLSQFPNGVYCSTLNKLYVDGFKGETSLLFRTKVLREYPFPEIKNEKFITEAYIYDQIDQRYKFILFPCYSQICEYRDDGYTRNIKKTYISNPKGFMLYYDQAARLGKGKLWENIMNYVALSIISGNFKQIIKSSFPLLSIIICPLAIIKAIKLKMAYQKR